MYNKTILILSDGMRPDAVAQCGHPTAKRFCEAYARPCAFEI